VEDKEESNESEDELEAKRKLDMDEKRRRLEEMKKRLQEKEANIKAKEDLLAKEHAAEETTNDKNTKENKIENVKDSAKVEKEGVDKKKEGEQPANKETEKLKKEDDDVDDEDDEDEKEDEIKDTDGGEINVDEGAHGGDGLVEEIPIVEESIFKKLDDKTTNQPLAALTKDRVTRTTAARRAPPTRVGRKARQQQQQEQQAEQVKEKSKKDNNASVPPLILNNNIHDARAGPKARITRPLFDTPARDRLGDPSTPKKKAASHIGDDRAPSIHVPEHTTDEGEEAPRKRLIPPGAFPQQSALLAEAIGAKANLRDAKLRDAKLRGPDRRMSQEFFENPLGPPSAVALALQSAENSHSSKDNKKAAAAGKKNIRQ